MNTCIIGANMGFAKLPEPFGGVIYWRSENLLGCWESKLDSNGLQSSHFGEEENSGCCICFAPIKNINLIQEWQVSIMIVQYEQLILFQWLIFEGKIVTPMEL